MHLISLRLPDELFDAIEMLRGPVPRERYLRMVILNHVRLFQGETGPMRDGREYIAMPREHIVKALDAARGELSRVEFMQRLLARELGVAYPWSDDTPLPP